MGTAVHRHVISTCTTAQQTTANLNNFQWFKLNKKEMFSKKQDFTTNTSATLSLYFLSHLAA